MSEQGAHEIRGLGRGLTGVAIAYCLLFGLVGGVAFAALPLISTIQAGLAGCALGDGHLRFPVTPSPDGCWQQVELVSPLLAGVAAVLLVAGGIWLAGARRSGRRIRSLVPLSAAAVVLTGFFPAATMLGLIDFYRLATGPVEIGVMVAPLVWAIVSAGVLLQTWRAERQRGVAGTEAAR